MAKRQLSVTKDAVTNAVPCDLEGERRILGILIRHPKSVDSCIDRLRDHHFYDAAHRIIFRVIQRLYQESGRISYTQVYNVLTRENLLPNPKEILLALTESFVSRAELEPSVESVLETHARRRLLEAAQTLEEMIYRESDLSTAALQARAQELIFAATRTEEGVDDVKPLGEVLLRVHARLEERKEGKLDSFGLPVMYQPIDGITAGFKKKDLIILAGRPSMGKTSLALNMAVNVARRKKPVLIFSLEMDDEQIGDRLVLGECFRLRKPNGEYEVTAQDYAVPVKLADEQFEKIGSIFNDLYSLPIYLVDKRGLSVSDIKAKARKVAAELGNEGRSLALIIIDYLQLIQPPVETNKNWALVVGEIVREIRDLAGELDLPIILLSQLNRSVEQRPDRRPQLSDLRDSGNIEEFADVVMFIYRREYYFRDEPDARGKAEVIVAKNRKGPTATATLTFVPEFTRFVDLAREEQG
ncbi:MAG: replicative DNA helicase [Betaproteobacteria bacterium]